MILPRETALFFELREDWLLARLMDGDGVAIAVVIAFLLL